jgi:hypothetical protein
MKLQINILNRNNHISFPELYTERKHFFHNKINKNILRIYKK